jgi:predicted permease
MFHSGAAGREGRSDGGVAVRVSANGEEMKALQDLRYAIRQLRLAPGFALVAIASLALGIGANAAIFQLLDAVRLRSLPIPNPKELAEVRIVGGNHGFGINDGFYSELTRPVWHEIKEHHEPFSGVFAWASEQENVGQGVDSRPVRTLDASGEFFPVMGIHPWRGRLFTTADERGPDCTITQVVASYPFWQSEMGGRELGANDTVTIGGHPAQVIGVTPPGFFGMAVGETFDLAVPMCNPKTERAEVFDVSVMGRLRPEWSLERASALMAGMSAGVFQATAPSGYSSQAVQQFKNYKLGVYSASGGVSLLRAVYDRSLQLLLGISGLVLLIACANLANLMLARASVREREFAVRLALGASRRDLLRQSLVESGLLAFTGTLLGVGLAQFLGRALIWSLSSEDNPISLATGADWRVMMFAAAVAIVTCLMFGAAPAVRSISAQPVTAMKRGGRGMIGGRERFSMQRGLVVVQISVSLVLLVSALLFVRSFHALMTVDSGMREQGITRAFLQFPGQKWTPDSVEAFRRELLTEIRSVPGVVDAATTTNIPLLGGSWSHGVRVGAVENSSKFTWVSPTYFKTMGISVVAGRGFSDNDTATSPRVAVVNQTFIRQFLGGANPIGHTLTTNPEPDYPSTTYEIVGVIPDTKYNDIRGETPPMTFAPGSQFPVQMSWAHVMIYSSVPVEAAIRRKLAETHPQMLPFFSDFQTEIVQGLRRERMLAMLSGFFGVLAVVLATVGLYGVVSYMIARRRNEIGIRMALGASRGRVIAIVMREAAVLLAVGLIAGAVLAVAAGRGAESLLFGLKPSDPLTLLTCVLLLSMIAALASFIPARRAAKVDPMVALRYE